MRFYLSPILLFFAFTSFLVAQAPDDTDEALLSYELRLRQEWSELRTEEFSGGTEGLSEDWVFLSRLDISSRETLIEGGIESLLTAPGWPEESLSAAKVVLRLFFLLQEQVNRDFADRLTALYGEAGIPGEAAVFLEEARASLAEQTFPEWSGIKGSLAVDWPEDLIPRLAEKRQSLIEESRWEPLQEHWPWEWFLPRGEIWYHSSKEELYAERTEKQAQRQEKLIQLLGEDLVPPSDTEGIFLENQLRAEDYFGLMARYPQWEEAVYQALLEARQGDSSWMVLRVSRAVWERCWSEWERRGFLYAPPRWEIEDEGAES